MIIKRTIDLQNMNIETNIELTDDELEKAYKEYMSTQLYNGFLDIKDKLGYNISEDSLNYLKENKLFIFSNYDNSTFIDGLELTNAVDDILEDKYTKEIEDILENNTECISDKDIEKIHDHILVVGRSYDKEGYDTASILKAIYDFIN